MRYPGLVFGIVMSAAALCFFFGNELIHYAAGTLMLLVAAPLYKSVRHAAAITFLMQAREDLTTPHEDDSRIPTNDLTSEDH